MTPTKRLARIAGLLYLGVALTAFFAELVVRDRVVVDGDATATADGIRSSSALFRVGALSDLLHAALFLVTAMALFALFRDVSRLAAAAMVAFVAVSVAIQSVNMLSQYAALDVATDPAYAAALGGEAADLLVLQHVETHATGFLVAQMFFAAWLVPLGYLVVRSRSVPRVIGVLLVVGAAGYLAEYLTFFLAPETSETVLLLLASPAGVAELLFVGWLLVRGIRVPAEPTGRGVPRSAATGTVVASPSR